MDHGAEWREARDELDSQARIAGDNAARAFRQQALVADRVNLLLAGMDAAQVKSEELAIHQSLLALIAPIPDIDGIVIIDAAGEPLVAANAYPVPKLDLADRPYFKGTMAADSGRFVSGLETGTVIKRRFFGYGRRWTDRAGAVRGVIEILVSPRYFEDLYDALLTEQPGKRDGRNIALLRMDGTLLTGTPAEAAARAAAAGISGFRAAIADAPDSGDYRQDGAGSGGAALTVYRRVATLPLYIAASLPEAVIVADWREKATIHLLITLPVTLLFSLLLGIALQRVQREDAARATLDAEMERRAAAENTLLRSQRLEAVGQVTGGVAHDFNNLLTIIMGCAELLERRPSNSDNVCRLARNIRGAAERGADITASLLAFSRRQPMRAEVVDVNRALLDFVPLLRRAARESAVVLLDLAPQVLPVTLDPGQFEAAILNLVGNARDALPQGGRICISTRSTTDASAYPEAAQGPVTVVTVTDDGTGMDAATAARAVEPFFTTKEIGRGTGLGLSQVYGFVKQSEGEFRIETAPGRGTSVLMVLPCCAAKPAAPRTLTDEAGGGAAGEVVLVVEDEAIVRATVVEVLLNCGYRTLDAPHAEGALALLQREKRVDLLFSDLVMPGSMNGLELAEAARQLHPCIRILVTSGYDAPFDGSGSPHAFLRKPYDPATLAVRVRQVLDLPRAPVPGPGTARTGICAAEASEEA
ncbi:MAG TPA: ATP-binding protein [Acidisoma sp.]|uniref:ATP-binding protein n=1 Tax=Acidisoma sp. TaxID=1872115 RepID=UPI002CEC7797|nr:ATP-binding protein [Acidisoma sp.]HTI02068.1 ATP-binding protein [Acidisoma sp.]